MISAERLAWIKLPEPLLHEAIVTVCGEPPRALQRLELSFSNDVYRVELEDRTVCARSHRGDAGYFAIEGWARTAAAATGVPVPELIGVAEVGGDVHYSVSIESWVEGDLLHDVLRSDGDRGRGLAHFVGEAARRLHSVAFEGPGKLDASGAVTQTTWAGHRAFGEPEEVAELAHSVGISRERARRAARFVNEAAHEQGAAVLLHGDLASKHALVTDRLAALLDFEFPLAGDCAEDLAYWSYCERGNGSIDSFLAGYGEDTPALRRRMLLERVRISLNYIAYSAPRGELVGEFRDWVASSFEADVADL